MNSTTHRLVARYIHKHHLPRLRFLQKHAFYLGCIQPDKNPATYLKGSMKHAPLRGHNWSNAKNHIQKSIQSMMRRKRFGVCDYYRFGKILHYLADAFTFTHNDAFSGNLNSHRKYEKHLEFEMRKYLQNVSEPQSITEGNPFFYIHRMHTKYENMPFTPLNDVTHILSVCIFISNYFHKTAHFRPYPHFQPIFE